MRPLQTKKKETIGSPFDLQLDSFTQKHGQASTASKGEAQRSNPNRHARHYSTYQANSDFGFNSNTSGKTAINQYLNNYHAVSPQKGEGMVLNGRFIKKNQPCNINATNIQRTDMQNSPHLKFNELMYSGDKGRRQESPCWSQIGKCRQTLSHNTVEQLINKFQDSLSPLKLKILTQNEQISPDKRDITLTNDNEVRQKDHQIKLLRLELQRYERCDTINKQKQAIYQRLVKKIKKEVGEIKREQQDQQVKYRRKREVSHTVAEQAEITPFHHGYTNRNIKTEQPEQQICRTPFQLVEQVESAYIVDREQEGKCQVGQPGSIKKKSTGSNMTFNGNRLKGKPKYYENGNVNVKKEIPQERFRLGDVVSQGAQRLSQMNNKLWKKRQQKQFKHEKVVKNTRSSLYCVPHRRERIESTKTLLSYNL